MDYLYIIPFLSPSWWLSTTCSLLGIIAVVFLFWRMNEAKKEVAAQVFATILLFDFFFHFYYVESLGDASLATSLPLQFCSVMQICSIVALLTRSIWIYEVILLFGIVGPIQAIITPAFAYSGSYYFYEYFICHGLIITTPLVLTFGFGMRPRVGAWWRVPLQLLPMIPIVMLINYFVEGNYMFLNRLPSLNHTMAILAWPFYIFIWIGGLVFCGWVISHFVNRLKT